MVVADMSCDNNPTLYLFGDRHTDDRDIVLKRMRSVVPENAEVIVMEHAGKGENELQPSKWVWLKNPSLLLIQLLILPIQYVLRKRSNRIFHKSQTSAPEEVANELSVPIEFSDISWEHRLARQPHYLTVFSTFSILFLIYIPITNVGPLLLPIIFVFATGFWTHREFSQMRERIMAEDIRELAEDNSVIVYISGDSHLDPVRKLLEQDLKIISCPDSRP